MFLFFNELKRLYYFIVAISCVILLITQVIFNTNFLITFLFLVTLNLLVLYKLNLFAFGKLVNIISNECDPEKFISLSKKMMNTKLYGEIIKKKIQAHFVWALMWNGSYEEALQNLNTIQKSISKKTETTKQKKVLNTKQISIYQLLIGIYTANKDFKNVRKVYEELKEYITNSKVSKMKKDDYKNILTSDYLYINFLEGNFENSEEIFKLMEIRYLQEYKNSYCKLLRISAKFHLGNIYLRFNKNNEAKEAFEYVVSMGNKLNIVNEARSYLDSMQ
ncbi:UNVERIFIED_CONTAM: hypothetical protein Cloal_1557 [Acetivibrio alkalicellulosi]